MLTSVGLTKTKTERKGPTRRLQKAMPDGETITIGAETTKTAGEKQTEKTIKNVRQIIDRT